MAKVFWVCHDQKLGGISDNVAMQIVLYGADIATMREYMKCWHAGYEMGWQPPEWIQNIFPPTE